MHQPSVLQVVSNWGDRRDSNPGLRGHNPSGYHYTTATWWSDTDLHRSLRGYNPGSFSLDDRSVC